MFLKNVKEKIFSKLSIRTKLTIFYSLAAFILLITIALFLYWESINILYKADYQFLSDEVNNIQYILNNPSNKKLYLNDEVLEFCATPKDSIYRYYIRISDNHNQTLVETPGLNKILPTEKVAYKKREPLIKKNYRWYTQDDSNYLIIRSPIILPSKQSGTVQIVLDISYQHSVISDRKILIAAILGSALCSLLLGFFITRRGIKSLYVLTETAKNITATSLHQRIDPKSWPKELRILGLAFNHMLDRIECSFIRLKQFSDDLAHELRTPINNLTVQTEIILSHPHSIAEYQQVSVSNLEELQRVKQLIENILFLSRAENPKLAIQKSLLNVRNEIEQICTYYQPLSDEKNIQVSYEGEAHLRANSIMFRRMLTNILSNALKYTHSGGLIHFEVSVIHQYINIMITDNGIGIAKEHLPKLFDRFYRVDSARSQQSGGIGLGLAIVKSIVDLHHGSITIDSNLEKGTRISLSFPKG